MGKANKKSSSRFQQKIGEHKDFTNKIAKHISDAFLINRLMGMSPAAAGDGPDPFEFIITIAIQPGISISSINVNGVIARKEDFKIDGQKLICTVKAFVSTLTFLLIIDAEGEPNSSTTFNLTCDGDKVFKEDQSITIGASGRGGFSNPKVPLP